MKKYSPFLGLAAGVVVSIPMAVIVFFAAGTGEGSYLPMRVIFPFTILFSFTSITAPLALVGLVQFPL